MSEYNAGSFRLPELKSRCGRPPSMRPRTHDMVVGAALLMCLTGFAGGVACSSHQSKTVRTESFDAPAANPDEPPTRETTTTTTESDDRSPGVIGSAFHLVWAVISFPFRVIGDLF